MRFLEPNSVNIAEIACLYPSDMKRLCRRIIYYFHSHLMPLYLLTMFAKNERANLSKAERNELAGLVDLLVQFWSVR